PPAQRSRSDTHARASESAPIAGPFPACAHAPPASATHPRQPSATRTASPAPASPSLRVSPSAPTQTDPICRGAIAHLQAATGTAFPASPLRPDSISRPPALERTALASFHLPELLEPPPDYLPARSASVPRQEPSREPPSPPRLREHSPPACSSVLLP